MFIFAFSFLCGVFAFQWMSWVPPPWMLLGLTAVFLVLFRKWLWLGALGIGFTWAGWDAYLILNERLPESLARKDLVLSGYVAGLPEREGDRWRFQFQVESVESAHGKPLTTDWRGRARLSWRGTSEQLASGQRWRLSARLFEPKGLSNPGAFDYERWLFTEAISATGYVRKGKFLIGAEGTGFMQFHHRVRGSIRERLDALPGPPDGKALLKALVIGDRGSFDERHWSVFRATGTSHLVAISGLHLGLIAGFGFLWGGWLWRRSAWLCLRWPASHAGAMTGIVLAASYALLAGFSLPTQRALLMLTVGVFALLGRRLVSPPHVLALVALVVVIFDPTAVLQAGFWLSFGAVAVILFLMTGRLRRSRAADWWMIQWAIALGLIPFLVGLGFPVSMVAPLVNLIAVPWFAFVMVPISLIGVSVASVEVSGLNVFPLMAVQLSEWSFNGLERIAGWREWTWSTGADYPAFLLLAVIGVAVLLAPIPRRHRLLGAAMFLPVLFYQSGRVGPDDMRLAMLDVGQGLSLVVETASRTLVYDLGPRYESGFNTAESVVIPYLTNRGIDVVDRLVLSHDDIDHSGAWQRFQELIPVNQIFSSQTENLPERAIPCQAHQRWTWDQVDFEILHPTSEFFTTDDNDMSCVLRIVHPSGSVIIAGDITERVERMLVDTYGTALDVDYLVVPHHGSATSSSGSFVKVTAPKVALVSAGYGNRYGFPAPDVANRWRNAGAKIVNTATSGAILVDFEGDAEPKLMSFREIAHRYWNWPSFRY